MKFESVVEIIYIGASCTPEHKIMDLWSVHYSKFIYCSASMYDKADYNA